MVKNLPAMQETWVPSWVGKIPWRRAWQPTPVFLPGESHGQWSLAGYSPRGCKVGCGRATKHIHCVTQCLLAKHCWDFPDGPVVKTLDF